MPILFDYNPDTGVSEYFDYDPVKDQVLMTYSQDASLMLDRMQAMRNNPDIWKDGVDESFALYCSIPPVIEMELLNRGLKLENKDDLKAILKIINTEYPHLRATDKWHR